MSAVAGSGLNVPAAIAYLAAALFILAALRLLQLRIRPESSGNGFASLIAAGLAGIGGWIAIGPGARVCGVGSAESVMASAEGLACRVPFGAGALIAAGMAVYAARRWVREARGQVKSRPRG